MCRLRLIENLRSRKTYSGIEAFLFNVNISNYSKREMLIIYGQVDSLSYKTIDKLLDKAFKIEDFKTIDQLLKLYE